MRPVQEHLYAMVAILMLNFYLASQKTSTCIYACCTTFPWIIDSRHPYSQPPPSFLLLIVWKSGSLGERLHSRSKLQKA